MNYFYVLYIIFMVLSCVICMTFILFIYVYYRLFVCTNLVDVMSLFFMIFSFNLLIFDKKRPVPTKIVRKWPRRFSEKPTDLSAFLIFTVSSSSPVRFGRFFLFSTDFYCFFSNRRDQ
jgi:hypothetical protein